MPLRLLASAVVVAVAVGAIWTTVVLPWRCGSAEMRIGDTTAQAWAAPGQPRSRELAEANLRELAPCVRAMPTSIICRTLAAQNQRLLLRHDDAVASLRGALEYDRRPELYHTLGVALVEAGRTEEAIEPFVQAGLFTPKYIPEIYPDELRLRVDEIVSQRRLLPWHEVLPQGAK
jgi:tetratricopeptide (TPR) repeat protein